MESEAIFFKLMGSLSDICWVRVLYGISVICLLFSCSILPHISGKR